MNEKVKVILRDGSTVSLEAWQSIYGLPVGSNKIGKFFSLNEHRFRKDIAAYGSLVVNELLMIVLDEFRSDLKMPVTLNSFNRSEEHQAELKSKGYRAATYSPHVVKLAGDIDTPGPDDLVNEYPGRSKEWLMQKAKDINRARAILLRSVSNKMNIMTRIGNETYLNEGYTFIHVDVCPEYYAKHAPWANHFHPVQWERPISW